MLFLAKIYHIIGFQENLINVCEINVNFFLKSVQMKP
jgi:hypothetical protein